MRAASQVEAFLWVTNYASHSNSLTFNSSDIRYAVTNVTNSAIQWPVTNSAGWTLTNLLTHLGANPPLGLASYNVAKSTTNAGILVISAPGGSNLTVVPLGSGGSNWAYVVYVTNTYASTTNVNVPRGAYSATAQSNIISGLVSWLNQFPRNAEIFTNWWGPFTNFLTTATNAQSFTNKSFSGGTFRPAYLQATQGNLVNMGASNLTVTNFSSPGAGVNSLQLGAGARASALSSTAVGDSAEATNQFATALGYAALASGNGSLALGNNSYASNGAASATAVGGSAQALAPNSLALGVDAVVSPAHSNSTALGFEAFTTAPYQIRLGNSSETTSIPGSLDVNLTATINTNRSTNLIATVATLGTANVGAGNTTNTTMVADLGIFATSRSLAGYFSNGLFHGTAYFTGGYASNLTFSAVSGAIGTAWITNGIFTTSLLGTNFALSQGTITKVTVDNARFTGLNTNVGALINVGSIVSTLAAGPNLLTRTSNNLVYFTASGGATINAITNTGGVVADDWFRFVNKTGANLDFAHASAVTTAPENCQLITPGGITLSVPNNADGMATYDAVSARWRITSSSFSSVSALTLTGSTNSLVFANTNVAGTLISGPYVSVSVTGDTNVFFLQLLRK